DPSRLPRSRAGTAHRSRWAPGRRGRAGRFEGRRPVSISSWKVGLAVTQNGNGDESAPDGAAGSWVTGHRGRCPGHRRGISRARREGAGPSVGHAGTGRGTVAQGCAVAKYTSSPSVV